MAKKLQEHSHEHVDYNRPDLEWQCGHTCFGKSCPLGPNTKGECRGKQSECYPVKKNDRWQCTRSSIYGGKCEQGPNPDGTCCKPLSHCQPIRSLRSKRKILTLVTVAATLGLILMFVGGNIGGSRNMMMNPGKLTAAHSPEEINCMSCHSSISDDKVVTADLAGAHHAAGDSQNCLSCHEQEIGHWESARFSHGLTDNDLQLIIDKAKGMKHVNNAGVLVNLAGSFSAREAGEKGSLACVKCHTEHGGRDVDLTAMSNEQCQSCHSNKFESFSNGHPEFSNYPYERRTRIYFDHVMHFKKYFGSQKNKWEEMVKGVGSCNACHEPDIEGAEMVLKPFETSCASCHSNLTEKGGVAVVSLPSMDPSKVTAWPKPPIRGPVEMSPLMQLFVAMNENTHQSVEDFHALDNPMSLGEAHEQEKAEQLKSHIQNFISEWREKGGTDVFDHENSPVSKIVHDLAHDILSSVPPETFELLLAEMNQAEVDHHASKLEAPVEEETEEAPVEETEEEEEGEINLFDMVDDEEEAEEGEELDLFAMVDDSEEEEEAEEEDGEMNLFDMAEDEDEEDEEEEGESESQFKIAGTIAESASGRKRWAEKSNWVYENYAISYQSQGHADPFLKALIEHSASESADKSDWSGKLATQILEKTSAGKCLSCHTVDSYPDGSVVVNWNARESDLKKHFTRFVHTKHASTLLLKKGPDFVPGEAQTCFTCHEFNDDEGYREHFPVSKLSQALESPLVRDPHDFKSNFSNANMRQACAACHTPSEAGDGCLKCHNYHVDELR